MIAKPVRNRREPASRCVREVWNFLPGRKPETQVSGAVCSVACLEWANADEGTTRICYGHSKSRDCLLKYSLQKRLRDG